MSFFFTKAKPRNALKPNVGAQKSFGVTPHLKRQAPALHRAGCSACPLNTATDVITPKMEPTLAWETNIYFLAEAPGSDEDTHSHRPLTGPSGALLRECIPEGEKENCSFDNIVNCRPAKNRTPSWQEVECCRPRRWKYIEKAKPKLIVGLGLVPLHAILGSTDLQGMRGRIFAVKIGNHHCHFMPTYHPSFILQTAFDKRKPLQSKFGHCLKMDIKRAFAEVGYLDPPVIDTEAQIRAGVVTYDGSAGQLPPLLALLKKAHKAPLKAIDLETKGLRPFSEGAAIMSAALSFEDTNFSFALDHPQAKWGQDERKQIGVALEQLLRDKKSIKAVHNLPFEMEWFIWLYGKDIADHGGWECTQMQSHFLDERRGKQHASDDQQRATYQSLDFLCKQHFGISYKSIFKLNKKDMSKSDLGETLIYNAVDTKYTLRLFLKQETILQRKKLHEAYLDALPRQITVALMQTLGIGVDQTTVTIYQNKLGGEIAQIEAEITSLDVVKQFVKDNGRFDPLSVPQAIKLFWEYLKRPEVKVADKMGKIRSSVDKGVLELIDHPLAQLLLTLRNRNKLKSTYVDALTPTGGTLFPDGLVHCNFNTTFTETGRTSSDELNMQNFPSRNDSWIRKQIIAGPNQVLLAFDYGQLEACTAAMCSQDKVLVKALWEDYDIHLEWTQKLYKRYPLILGSSQSFDDPKMVKKLRSLVKNKLVFPAIFGAQNASIAGYLNCPEDVIDDLMEQFWATFSGLHNWQKRLMKSYYETGAITSYVGRPRHYPLTRNQAINHPVQCLAAEIVCNAMNRLSEKAVKDGNWLIHPRLNIHDDMTFAIPNDDKIIEDCINQIYRIMLTPPYECINVPLSVKASIGHNWFEMEEIGQFWSHKDL